MSSQPHPTDPTLVDIAQRLARLEERFETGDPRVAEALETARAALSRAASSTEAQEAIRKLEADLKKIEERMPRARPIPVDDPVDPVDPTNSPGGDGSNDPDPQPTPAPAPPGSPSPPAPPTARPRHRRRHGM